MKATTVLAILAVVVLMIGALFSAYAFGKMEGTAFGYNQGIRVADAWERRAKQCEVERLAEIMSEALPEDYSKHGK